MVALLEDHSSSILVPGIAGIGKTSLAGKLLEHLLTEEIFSIIDAKTGRGQEHSLKLHLNGCLH